MSKNRSFFDKFGVVIALVVVGLVIAFAFGDDMRQMVADKPAPPVETVAKEQPAPAKVVAKPTTEKTLTNSWQPQTAEPKKVVANATAVAAKPEVKAEAKPEPVVANATAAAPAAVTFTPAAKAKPAAKPAGPLPVKYAYTDCAGIVVAPKTLEFIANGGKRGVIIPGYGVALDSHYIYPDVSKLVMLPNVYSANGMPTIETALFAELDLHKLEGVCMGKLVSVEATFLDAAGNMLEPQRFFLPEKQK